MNGATIFLACRMGLEVRRSSLKSEFLCGPFRHWVARAHQRQTASLSGYLLAVTQTWPLADNFRRVFALTTGDDSRSNTPSTRRAIWRGGNPAKGDTPFASGGRRPVLL
jgi:hypothetical protein